MKLYLYMKKETTNMPNKRKYIDGPPKNKYIDVISVLEEIEFIYITPNNHNNDNKGLFIL